jgi:prophage regulatory protein
VFFIRQEETNMNTQRQHPSQTGSIADRLITFAKARTFVGLSRSKIYLLLAANDFPAPVKIGRNNYFSELELQAWIEAQLNARTNNGLAL